MSVSAPEIAMPEPVAGVGVSPAASKLRLGTMLAVPLAIVPAVGVHWLVQENLLPIEARSYFLFLGLVFGVSIMAVVLQTFLLPLRRWMGEMCPIIAAAVVTL